MGLRDLRAKAIFQARVECPIGRNPGDVRPVGVGISELQIKVALVTGSIYNNGDRCCSLFLRVATKAPKQ